MVEETEFDRTPAVVDDALGMELATLAGIFWNYINRLPALGMQQ